MAYVGQPIRRREDRKLVQGLGAYLDDIAPYGTLHAVFVRSPYAHGRLLRVDTEAARRLPGVVAVVTAADVGEEVRPVRARSVLPGYLETDRPVLATDTVRFVGEMVACVVADDRYRAADAAAAVELAIAPLPVVADPEQGAVPDSPRVHASLPHNVIIERTFQAGDVEQALAAADVVVRGRFRSQRQAAAPMEGRGCLALFERGLGQLTCYSSTQMPHMLRTGLAEHLGLPEHRIRVIPPDIGGGFGLKSNITPEELCIAWLARRLGRPVKWVETRQENLLASQHAREQVYQVAAGFRRDGTLLALDADLICDAGAYGTHPTTVAAEPLMAGGSLTGPYRLEHYRCRARGVATNKCPVGGYRGVARPASTFVMERVMDLGAAALGLDPLDLRRRNLIRAEDFPYTTVTRLVYDSASFRESLEEAARLVDYPALRAEQARLRSEGRYLGIGLSCYMELTALGSRLAAAAGWPINPGHEMATVRIGPSGKLNVLAGVVSIGQGLETALAQIAADELGVPLGDVAVTLGDTAITPYGMLTGASRAAVLAGGAIALAAGKLREKIRAIAGALLEAAPADLELADGRVSVRGVPERYVTLREVAHTAHYLVRQLPPGTEPGLEATAAYDPVWGTSANGSHVALVEVDPETGRVTLRRYLMVEDCGRPINPLILEGQAQGGAVQGIAGALQEELIYDRDGQLLTGTLMDYAVPVAATLPPLEVHHLETPSKVAHGGFKGAGEGATIGATAAVANAVADALRPFGARVTELPLTPERVLRLIGAGRTTQGSSEF